MSLHKTEDEIAFNHIALDFEHQNGSSLQIVIQNAYHYISLNFKSQKEPFSSFLYRIKAGTGMGTFATIEISQEANNADQKVNWFLKVHKTYKPL